MSSLFYYEIHPETEDLQNGPRTCLDSALSTWNNRSEGLCVAALPFLSKTRVSSPGLHPM